MEEHSDHVDEVFKRLKHYGLKINIKCEFAVPKLTFLGHMIDGTGITPVIDEVEAIKEFPQPSTLHQLQRFMDMINYYRQFVPHCSKILLPLTDLLCNQKKKNSKIILSSRKLTAFNDAKEALISYTKLCYIV